MNVDVHILYSHYVNDREDLTTVRFTCLPRVRITGAHHRDLGEHHL